MMGARTAGVMVVAAMLATMVAPSVARAKTKPDQRRVGDATAQCVVAADKRHVRALLATLPGSSAERTAARKVEANFAACSEGAYKLSIRSRSPSLFNGRADLAAAMAIDLADAGAAPAAADGPWYAAMAKAAPKGGYDSFLLGVQEFGACVVAADAGGALKLVRAPAGSREGIDAVTALRGVLSPCVTGGIKLNFTRDELRLALAEPLYHALTGGPAAPAR